MTARVALIGAGTISAAYLRNLVAFPDLEVVAVADRHLDRAEARAEEFAVPRAATPAEAVAMDDIDVIVNVTTPASHAEISLLALRHGKHVWSEKPLALDHHGAVVLQREAGKLGLRIGCAPDTMLGAGMQTARRVIQSGEIGEPISALTLFEIPGPPDDHPGLEVLLASGAGPLWDMGPYYFTALAHIFGSFSQVVARARTQRPMRYPQSGPHAGQTITAEVPTHVSVLSQFASGAQATSVFSWDTPLWRVGHVEVSGTKATLAIPDPDCFDGPLRITRAREREWATIPTQGPFQGRGYEGRGVGVVDMVRSIAAGEPSGAAGGIAAHIVEVMEAASRSIARGGPVAVDSRIQVPAILPAGWDPFDVA